MTDYRWNQLATARGYDAAAAVVHPHYHVVQDVILEHLPLALTDTGVVVDLGGGSGRLAERILERFPQASVWVIDQSEAFLTLARERLQRFGKRGVCLVARLQTDWSSQLSKVPQAIVSMSAIHHLDPGEKRFLYQRCAECLAPGGVLMNGDEIRPESDDHYLAECRRWAEHMHHEMDRGQIPEPLHAALLGWEARNVNQFATPRVSGDDCHETADMQLQYFQHAGLRDVRLVWQRDLWAVLFGRTQGGD